MTFLFPCLEVSESFPSAWSTGHCHSVVAPTLRGPAHSPTPAKGCCRVPGTRHTSAQGLCTPAPLPGRLWLPHAPLPIPKPALRAAAAEAGLPACAKRPRPLGTRAGWAWGLYSEATALASTTAGRGSGEQTLTPPPPSIHCVQRRTLAPLAPSPQSSHL